MFMWKKIKFEIFFIRKLLKQGYGPRGFYNYFKNKFFGLYLLNKLPRYGSSRNDDFEIHVLTQKSGLWMLVWALRSFLYFSRLNPRIVVHDDGSIDAKTARLFESKFTNLEVLRRREADNLIAARKDIPIHIKKYRQGKNVMILALLDHLLLSKTNKIMVMDNDILFFDYPEEVVDFVKKKSQYDSLILCSKASPLTVDEAYLQKYNLREKRAERLNSGLVLINKEKMGLNKLIEYFQHTLDTEGHFIEQAGWSCLVAQTNFNFFPEDKYIVKGGVKNGVILKHFTSPRRHEMFAEGIDKVRKKLYE